MYTQILARHPGLIIKREEEKRKTHLYRNIVIRATSIHFVSSSYEIEILRQKAGEFKISFHHVCSNSKEKRHQENQTIC